jgi:carbon storage regulator
MLYLNRKLGEKIIINHNIELTIVEIRGKCVKIGFTFPEEATILRKETHEKIMKENIAASQATLPLHTFQDSASSLEKEDELP